MEYRAVDKRCTFDFDCLQPEARKYAEKILSSLGFVKVEIDLIGLARSRIKRSRFVKGVHPDRAPEDVNCSSFVRWLFGQCGILLPRLAVQQRMLGQVIMPEDMLAGDLIFMTGRLNLFENFPGDGVGHVGIVTGRGTIIHAKGVRSGIVEEPVKQFLRPARFRGMRRLIPAGHRVQTYKVPERVFIETSDDIRWLILMNLWRFSDANG